MASYDVTDSAMQGYALIWKERAYLLRLAIFPLLIKFVCATTVIMNGYEFDFIKQSLLMLPSYFADGWVMSHLVRLIFLDQRWPFRPTGNSQTDMATLRDRAGGIMAGTVCFALLEFLKTGLIGVMFMAATPPGTTPEAMLAGGAVDPAASTTSSPYTAVMGMALIVLTIWMIRYLWLYIPAAAGFSGRAFLRRVGGMMGSIRLLGVWMICSIPILFLFMIIASVLLGSYTATDDIPAALDFLMNGLRVTVIMLTTLITTAGMAYVIRGMFAQTK